MNKGFTVRGVISLMWVGGPSAQKLLVWYHPGTSRTTSASSHTLLYMNLKDSHLAQSTPKYALQSPRVPQQNYGD